MALVLMVSPTVSAEDGDTAAPAVESAPDVAATQTTASTEALEQQLAAQQAQIAALTGELGAVKTRMDAAEEAAAQKELEAAAEAFRPSLEVYGFLTAYFQKVWIPEDSVLRGAMLSRSYFSLNDLNVYFSSQLSPSFSALVELGFTFMPNGADATVIPYSRYNTTVADLRTSRQVTLGGVFIERAQATWQPRDFFGITAGRFFTPYGIWNLDHGPTVVLTPRLPYLILREALPMAQTGVMIHGSFFSKRYFRFEYALTLSNGRGPTEAAFDINENKAVGLRLKAVFKKDDMVAHLGGYGFYGTVSDTEKVFDPTTVAFRLRDRERYSELVGALDFSLRVKGLQFQTEFVRSITRYSLRPVELIPEVNIEMPGQYQPDFYQWDFYGLLGWEFAVYAQEREMFLTPWFMLERSVFDDTYPDMNLFMYSLGLTFRPASFVSWKLAGMLLNFPESDIIHGNTMGLQTQLAVAF